jgi:hypothetical protein
VHEHVAEEPQPQQLTRTFERGPALSAQADLLLRVQRSAGNAAARRLVARWSTASDRAAWIAALQALTADQLVTVIDAIPLSCSASAITLTVPSIPLPTVPLDADDAAEIREQAILLRMQRFYEARTVLLGSALPIAPSSTATPGDAATAAAGWGRMEAPDVITGAGPIVRPGDPVTAPPPPRRIGPGGVDASELDRLAQNRQRAVQLRYLDARHLTVLRRITDGRPDRWRHPDPRVQEAILSALQLEAVGALEDDFADPARAGGVHHASGAYARMGDSFDWCGFTALYSYRFAGMPERLRASLFHVLNVEALFRYQNTERTPTGILLDGTVHDLHDYHRSRSSERKWTSAADIEAGHALDLRPGDVVLVDHSGTAGADHIQMVRSWDPATQLLFTIDGNGGGYEVEDRANRGARAGAPEPMIDARQAKVEAALGIRVRAGHTAGGHVGVGVHDLGNQLSDSAIRAAADPEAERTREMRGGRHPLKARVYGVGRFSIADFENHTYTQAPVGYSTAQYQSWEAAHRPRRH